MPPPHTQKQKTHHSSQNHPMDPLLPAHMEELRENTETVFSDTVIRRARSKWPESNNRVTNQNVLQGAFAPGEAATGPSKRSGNQGLPKAHVLYASNAIPQDTRDATSSSTAPYNMDSAEKMAFREDFHRMLKRWSRVQSQWVPGQFDPFRDDLDTIVPPTSNSASPASSSKSTLVDERMSTPAAPEEPNGSEKVPTAGSPVPIPPPEGAPQYRGCWYGREFVNGGPNPHLPHEISFK